MWLLALSTMNHLLERWGHSRFRYFRWLVWYSRK